MNKWKLLIVILLLFSTTIFSSFVTAQPSDKMVKAIVCFKTKINHRIISENGGKCKEELKNAPVLFIEIPEKNLGALNKNKDVEHTEEDGVWSSCSQVLPWGIDRIDAEIVQSKGENGSGIKIGVLDSGVSQHEDLSIAGGWNFVDNNSDYSDDYGHGTHVSGTISAVDNSIGVVGVAPGVQIYSLKVLDSLGNANWSTIAKAIDWSINNKMKILNMSFGGKTGSKTIEQLLSKTYKSGILLVAAAGNNGNNADVIYPAKYSSVIAVGATDRNNNIASFSNTGSTLELVAPGVDIYSTFLGNTYITESGTSMAAPHVTGTAALVWSKFPSLSNIQIRKKLQSTVTDLGSFGFDTTYGYGLINAYTAIQ